MTSDGGIRLRRAIERYQMVHVEKMFVLNSASGPFLQRIASFVDTILYRRYRDATFSIPNDNTIKEIHTMRAPDMRAFIAGSNIQLEILNIDQCALDRLPPTLARMARLESLTINNCKLQIVRLDMLVDNRNLKILDLSNNRIRHLIPVVERSGRIINVENLKITGNLLDRLNMAVFASMPLLSTLLVWENRIVRLEASVPTNLPNLSILSVGYNQIASIDLSNLTLPNLDSLYLGPNALKCMPSLPRSLPKLSYFSLYSNNLTQLDLSYFRPYRNLERIVVSLNQITTVWTRSAVRLPVISLSLNDNKITAFNITGCDMPNITHLYLDDNRLTEIPSVFDRYPKARLVMDNNPLSCSTLLNFKDKLVTGQLHKDQKPLSMACKTTSSFFLEEETNMLTVSKMIVSISPSGPFLQRFSSFIDSVAYGNYHEATFVIPDSNTISTIEIRKASALRAFVAGTNTQLQMLDIFDCSLDRLPPTLPRMVKLKHLRINNCKLQVVQLDILVVNQNLTTLNILNNQIRQLVPVVQRPGRMLSVEVLNLVMNRLEYLDMAAFMYIPHLALLYLSENPITHLQVSLPTNLPKLRTLYISNNRLTTLNLRNLTLPIVEIIDCGGKALQQLPLLPRSLPKLINIALHGTMLTRLDLSYFRPYRNLQFISVTSGLITTVLASSPVQLPVVLLQLNDNRITTFNITGCDMPNITSLILYGNRLTAVPPVFDRYPKTRLTMDNNPLSCDTLLPFKEQLINYILLKDQSIERRVSQSGRFCYNLSAEQEND
uniref:Uncharacterized protein n=1 Tax=Anopheles epiroticus TaxID=199890 RepID=A0A182PQG0_9DIPT